MRQNRLIRHLVLPAAPLALAGASASTAEAAIVYTNIPDQTIVGAASRVYWDMGTGGGTGSFSNTFFPAADMVLFFGQNDSYVPDINHPAASVQIGYSYLSTTSFFATKFAAGATISGLTGGPGSASFAELQRNSTGNWPANGTEGYLGFRFDADGNGPGNNFNYGWAKISYNSNKSLTLYDFAYESSGAPIIAGAGAVVVPEPAAFATIAGLLTGSAALLQRRRKQPADLSAN